jgi:hypothetical protein
MAYFVYTLLVVKSNIDESSITQVALFGKYAEGEGAAIRREGIGDGHAVTAPKAKAPGLQTVPPHSHPATTEGFGGPDARY